MKKMLTAIAMCALGAVTALPASADDGHRGRRDERYGHRYDNREADRYRGRDDRYESRYPRRVVNRYERYAPRYVVNGRYCDDARHYRSAHYHVAPRDYYRYDYPREAYRLQRRSGIDATLVVTLPLF
jgi:hypothetical protein